MQFGFIIPTGDPRTVADLAQEVEAAGWDGAFYWDGIFIGDGPVYDPWVVMTAMAMRTERVRIGAILHPLSRRRPWKVAREAMTIDHVSNGRFVLPVGLGAIDDGAFGKVGEATDRKTRAELLDESLEIITGLWRGGEPFHYAGKHYHLDGVSFAPSPVQSPRIPIWVVGAWPKEKSMQRALRYDGLLPNFIDAEGKQADQTPEAIAAIRAYVTEHRPNEPFDIVTEGVTPGEDPAATAAIVQPYADAGATWWVESRWTPPNQPDDLRRRIHQGPPRL